MTRIGLFPLLTLIAVACGCSSLSGMAGSLNPLGPKYVTADARNPAVEVACIWQPGEGRGANGVPARGFSGQVFFFTNRDSAPVQVDGEMRVYLFADRGTDEERAKPLRQYDFAPEAWAAHATMTSLGPGYTVFVPYPATERHQVRCQLRARFTPREGPTIWSEAITMTLEGPPKPGYEPASWAGADRSVSPPTVIHSEVTHHRGTPAQLQAAAQADERPARTLRADTFRLGDIQQTAYETSRSPATSQSPAMETAATPRRSHPLAGTTGTGVDAKPHLLARPTMKPRRSFHPLGESLPPLNESPVMPTSDTGSMNGPSAAPDELQPRRFVMHNAPSAARRFPAAGETVMAADSFRPRHPIADADDGTASDVASTDEAAPFAPSNGDYGVWHPLAD